MRKNAKKILVGAVLILTLAIFTACGSRNNNADEVEKEMTGPGFGQVQLFAIEVEQMTGKLVNER